MGGNVNLFSWLETSEYMRLGLSGAGPEWLADSTPHSTTHSGVWVEQNRIVQFPAKTIWAGIKPFLSGKLNFLARRSHVLSLGVGWIMQVP